MFSLFVKSHGKTFRYDETRLAKKTFFQIETILAGKLSFQIIIAGKLSFQTIIAGKLSFQIIIARKALNRD